MDCGELSNLISKVLRPLDDARTEEFYKYIIFTGDGIVSYNDRICVFIKHRTNLECALPAKKFYSVLPKSGKADLFVDAGKLVIKTDNTTAKINVVKVPELMESVKSMGIKKKRKWKTTPPDFMRALNMCYPSASKEMNEPAMSCVSINDDVVAATDEVRISEYVMEHGIDEEVLIPAKSIRELIMYEGLSLYCIKDRWIYFTDESKKRKFCARIITAEFPDYKEHFDFDPITTITFPIKATVEAIRYVAPMAIEDEHGFSWMEVKMKKKNINFLTKDPDIGEATSDVVLRKALKKRVPTFTINPGFLMHIIRDAHKMVLGEDRAKFETENFTHLIALLHDQDDEDE